ncbi:hypothetical protein [Paraburkholderia sp. BL25I1N1]|uniref:hypothetical protein n=1 Tax=Paraburkholderia sp. BL25I1N1 TaxID=1938804 RepID=UPI000D076EA6|nr:hypothetical protein [Paraburkholderia sp. BL25I1N1]
MQAVLCWNPTLSPGDSFATLDHDADLHGTWLTLTTATELRIFATRFDRFTFSTFNSITA